ncbi:MAG: deoxyhypusine synthase family protein [Methanobacteriota archaeon]
MPALAKTSVRGVKRSDLLQTPVNQVDLTKVKTVADLLDNYKGMSFQARSLGTALTVYENMLTDPERPTIVMGLAGSLMAGGLRRVLRDMVKYNLVDVIVTVGSQPYQDLYAARGYDFWRSSPEADDLLLREFFLDRLYDTLVDEEKFRETDEYLAKVIAKLDPTKTYTTREIYGFLGRQFDDPDSWVAEAARQNVPVFSPALNDSSLGIGMVAEYAKAKKKGVPYPMIDPIRDAYELAQVKMRSKKTGVLYVAGGVSKNYIQQTEVISEVMGVDAGGHNYAIQLTTDAPHWGALSGCTFKEAQSWGKIAKNSKHVQAYVDVTIGLPLLVGALLLQPELTKRRKRLSLKWDDGELAKV